MVVWMKWFLDRKWHKITLIWILIGLTACTPADQEIPANQNQTSLTIIPTSTPVQSAPTKTPSSTAQPMETPTIQLTSTLRPTQPRLVETQELGVKLKLTVSICLETFCPPYWLDQESKLLLKQPGILASMALDEKDVLIIYNPEELDEVEVIELFVQTTNLEVEQ
jgi:hypothetical protein